MRLKPNLHHKGISRQEHKTEKNEVVAFLSKLIVTLSIVHLKTPVWKPIVMILLFTFRTRVSKKTLSRDQKVSKTNLKMAGSEDFFEGETLESILNFIADDLLDEEFDQQFTQETNEACVFLFFTILCHF